jgi:uncharacterized protein YbaR (Trm112 family)
MLRWKTECPVCRRQLQVTKRDRKVMEHNTPITSEDQEEANMQAAIQVFLSELDGMRQEGREPGEMSDAYWGMMGEEENEVDLLSALIIGQAISNIRRRPRRALARPTTPARGASAPL